MATHAMVVSTPQAKTGNSVEFNEELFGLRDQRLNDQQIADRERIAFQNGAEFRVGRGGKTTYSFATSDSAQLTAVREAIKAADLALNDGAPPAKGW